MRVPVAGGAPDALAPGSLAPDIWSCAEASRHLCAHDGDAAGFIVPVRCLSASEEAARDNAGRHRPAKPCAKAGCLLLTHPRN